MPKNSFPSRQNSALKATFRNSGKRTYAAKEVSILKDSKPQPNILYSAIVGIDNPPKPMGLKEINGLGDVFTQNVLLQGMNPMTLKELVDSIESISDRAYNLRKMFLVAEGGQFKINNPNFELNARLVFTWQLNNATPPDFLLSTVPNSSSNNSLLQLISWSYKDGSYHFFERKQGVWGWAGNSFTAFHPVARGKGPFDSHINGGLVMKELKFPWGHWHSQSNTIPREVFGTASEFNTNSLFAVLSNAEVLESIVKNGIRRWTKSRIRNDMEGLSIDNLTHYFRHIVLPTSINLVSSSIEFSRADTTYIPIPSSFFFDVDCIEYASAQINPLAEVVPADRAQINGALYKEIVTQLQMHVNSENDLTSEKGDTHFSFLVPERAFEDFEVCRQLVENKIISPRFLLALVMVDFSNPVDSVIRKHLMQYCPSKIDTNERFQLESLFIKSLAENHINEDSPEYEFLKYWEASDLLGLIKQELSSFISGIQNGLNEEVFGKKLVLLGEYRKQQFRKRPLSEFKSTTSMVDVEIKEFRIDKSGQIF